MRAINLFKQLFLAIKQLNNFICLKLVVGFLYPLEINYFHGKVGLLN